MTRYVPTATAGILGHRRFGYYTAGSGSPPPAFSPLSLSPALWIDPSDAASVTISGSSGAYIGANGLVCLGSGTNGAVGSALAAYNPGATSIDIKVRAQATDWTRSQTFAGKRGIGAANFGWQFNQNLAGNFFIQWGDSSTTATFDQSTVANTLVDGTTYWIRCTKNFATGSAAFYYAADQASVPSSWTQIGATVAGASGTCFADTNAVCVGSYNAGAAEQFQGTILRTVIDVNGTTVFNADFDAATPFVSAFTESALGAPVYVVSSTATSSTASYGYVGPEGWVAPGATGNVATTPDSAAVSPTTAVEIVVRARAAWSNGVVFYAKRSGGAETSAQGSQFYLNSSGSMRFFSNSGDVGVTHALVDGAWYWLKVTADGTATKFYFAADQSTEPVSWTQIGANQAAASFVDTGHLFSIGGDSQSGWKPVTIKRLILRKTIGGSADFDADFVTAADYCTTFTESSANAATVTITATNTPSNAAGACVSQINDKSGNARHLTQGTLANMPKYWNGQNGCNCLVFDGTNDYMSGALATAAIDDFAMSIVTAYNGSAAQSVPFYVGSGNSNGWGVAPNSTGSVVGWLRGGAAWEVSGTARRTGWSTYELARISGTAQVWLDGTQTSNASTSAPILPTTQTYLGTHNGSTFTTTCVLGEGIVWTTPTSQQLSDVRTYEKSKWGTP